ncbi:MAG: hypothetical protein WBD07_00040 [Vicinamibacterales bacterium]
MRADVDGVTYSSFDETGFRSAAINNGILQINSTLEKDPRVSVSVAVKVATVAARGTETIGASGVASCEVSIPGQPAVWKASGSMGSGSVTITSLSVEKYGYGETNVKGTLNCAAPPFSGGATGTKVVTNGSFSLSVSSIGK